MTPIPLSVAVIFLQAYLLGSIPFGLLVARSRGIDIREHGSKNIGATNVWRVLGKKWGLLTFFCDALKGVLAVLLAKWLVASVFPGAFTDAAFAGIIAALGCILGHTFPVWLRFKGGKGVATSLGVIVGMMPVASLVVLAIWAAVFKAARYVSLASIVASLALPIVVLAMLFTGMLHGWGNFYFACAAGLLVILRHRENISRLMAGTENRFGTPKPSAAAAAAGESSPANPGHGASSSSPVDASSEPPASEPPTPRNPQNR